VNEAICLRRANGLFVQQLGIEDATFDARHLRADQRGPVFKVLRAPLRPYCQLSVVSGQGLQVLMPPPLGYSQVVKCRAGKRTI
jgi:hypothetical protein